MTIPWMSDKSRPTAVTALITNYNRIRYRFFLANNANRHLNAQRSRRTTICLLATTFSKTKKRRIKYIFTMAISRTNQIDDIGDLAIPNPFGYLETVLHSLADEILKTAQAVMPNILARLIYAAKIHSFYNEPAQQNSLRKAYSRCMLNTSFENSSYQTDIPNLYFSQRVVFDRIGIVQLE